MGELVNVYQVSSQKTRARLVAFLRSGILASPVGAKLASGQIWAARADFILGLILGFSFTIGALCLMVQP
jgi:hypothetical protein